MQHKDEWVPTKFHFRRGKLKASRNKKEVGVGSRLATNITAHFYQKMLTDHAKGNLLDLGCGNVPLYAAYKDLVEDNYCVDWQGSLHTNKYLDQDADLNQKLPLDSDKFDTIILSSVLEHIRQPEQLVGEMNRVLKKGGKLLLNVPFYYCLHEVPHDYFRYTRYALESMLNDSGFNIVSIETSGGVPEVLCDIYAKNISAIPLIGVPFAKCIQWSTWGFVRTKPGRKLSVKTANKFPFGYCIVAEKI